MFLGKVWCCSICTGERASIRLGELLYFEYISIVILRLFKIPSFQSACSFRTIHHLAFEPCAPALQGLVYPVSIRYGFQPRHPLAGTRDQSCQSQSTIHSRVESHQHLWSRIHVCLVWFLRRFLVLVSRSIYSGTQSTTVLTMNRYAFPPLVWF